MQSTRRGEVALLAGGESLVREPKARMAILSSHSHLPSCSRATVKKSPSAGFGAPPLPKENGAANTSRRLSWCYWRAPAICASAMIRVTFGGEKNSAGEIVPAFI